MQESNVRAHGFKNSVSILAGVVACAWYALGNTKNTLSIALARREKLLAMMGDFTACWGGMGPAQKLQFCAGSDGLGATTSFERAVHRYCQQYAAGVSLPLPHHYARGRVARVNVVEARVQVIDEYVEYVCEQVLLR
ncbi:hypothetical protein D3C77_233150 [compost metagenome]